MRLRDWLNCLVKGHTYQRITCARSVYRYCLTCGILSWDHTHVKRRLPRSKQAALTMTDA